MAHYNTTELSGYTVVFFYHILQHSEGKIMLFLSQSYIMHMHYWYLKWIHIFVFFVRIHPFWSQGSNSWTLLVDLWNLGSKWASSILHTFYIVQLIHSGIILFWLILFFCLDVEYFFGYFFCFQYAYFFDYFLLSKNFFHHLCIWKRNMRVRGKKLFNKNICFHFEGKIVAGGKKSFDDVKESGDFVIIYLFIFVVFKEKLDAYSQGIVVCRVVT